MKFVSTIEYAFMYYQYFYCIFTGKQTKLAYSCKNLPMRKSYSRSNGTAVHSAFNSATV